MKTNTVPPCFSSAEAYALWMRGPIKDLPAAHCTDCLPSFKMKMAKCGRCEHPETVFAFQPVKFFNMIGVRIVGHWNRIPVLEAA